MRGYGPERFKRCLEFLDQTIGDESLAHDVRLRSAMRLADILLDTSARQQQHELRRERAVARQAESSARVQEAENRRVELSLLAERGNTADPADPETMRIFEQLLKPLEHP